MGKNFTFELQPKCYELLKACQLQQKPLTDTLEINIDDSPKIYCDIVAAPKFDDTGAILVFEDKTAHYRILEMRKDFIANASHELKTPITIIRGFAETLHDNPGLPEATINTITDKIVRNCNRMANLIKDLLTLADIEKIPESRLSECHILDVIKTCCDIVQKTCTRRPKSP